MKKNLWIIGLAIALAAVCIYNQTLRTKVSRSETKKAAIKRDSTEKIEGIKKTADSVKNAYRVGGLDSVKSLIGYGQYFEKAGANKIAVDSQQVNSAADTIRRLKLRIAYLEDLKKKPDTIIRFVRTPYAVVRTDTVTHRDPSPLLSSFVSGDQFYRQGDLNQFITLAPIIRYNLTTQNFTPGVSLQYRNGRLAGGLGTFMSNNTGRFFYTLDFSFDILRYPISRK